jgi:hypothetical protein
MEIQIIQSKIYELRGRRVMFDFDLAGLYEVPTKALKQTVRRNAKRFPDDFMFELTKSEWQELVTNCDRFPATVKHSSAPPFAFTEHGVTMLSGVLRSDIAVNISIQIVRAFVALRQLVMTSAEIRQLSLENAEIRAKIELLERNDEDAMEAVNDLSEDIRKDIDNLYNAIGELSVRPAQVEKPRRRIGFE